MNIEKIRDREFKDQVFHYYLTAIHWPTSGYDNIDRVLAMPKKYQDQAASLIQEDLAKNLEWCLNYGGNYPKDAQTVRDAVDYNFMAGAFRRYNHLIAITLN